MVQGGAAVVQNGEKEGWKWCRMGQGGATMVQNGARRGSDGVKWCKEGSNGAKWCKEGW